IVGDWIRLCPKVVDASQHLTQLDHGSGVSKTRRRDRGPAPQLTLEIYKRKPCLSVRAIQALRERLLRIEKINLGQTGESKRPTGASDKNRAPVLLR
ncbi:MAG TPA: hypothetical protein VN764_16575, partial [Polyangiaceae bacterium]|nr:hypothetical protein [Polyangiaceae bacterium]